jgi:hypothetical protein
MSPLWLLSLPDVDPLPQPGPTNLFRALLLLTFFLHLLPMNLALGGSVIALATRLTNRGHARHAAHAVEWFTRALPTIVAATVTFGVAPLLFLQVLYGRAFFGSAVLMAWPWLAVVPVLIAAYYAAYRLAYGPPARGLGLPALVAALLLVVSVIYSNNMSMMLHADQFADLAGTGASGWQMNRGDPTLVPRYLHMFLGAIAVAGGGLAVLGLWWWNRDQALGAWAIRRGSAWLVPATLLNLVTGSWWLLALPRDLLLRFMGRDPFAATTLMLGIVLGMVVLGAFAMAWRGRNPAPAVKSGLAALAATLVAMVLTRDQVRESALVLMGYQPNAWIETQWLPMAIFTLLLVGALATIAWMVGLLARAPARGGH